MKILLTEVFINKQKKNYKLYYGYYATIKKKLKMYSKYN